MDEEEWEAATPEGLSALLELADRALAERQIPVAERPLAALVELVQWQMIAGPDGLPVETDGIAIARHQSFRLIGKMIGEWYHQQYGTARMSRSSDDIVGFVLIRMSPFLIKVPSAIARPGDAPDTVWLCFIDGVSPTENVLDWLADMPNRDNLPDIASVRESIAAVGSDLRFIHTASLGALCGKDEQLLAFVRGVRSHLNQVARMLANQKTQDVAESYWEMQMAAEVALKSLLLQRTGSFPHTHSLNALLNGVSGFDASFPAGLLKGFPNDHETISRRYGTGVVSWDVAFGDYRTILNLLRNVAERWKRVELNGASICIRRAPWAIG